MLVELGRVVIILGIVLILLGVTLWFLGKLPFVGRLPGDIVLQRGDFKFYAPITTAILISLVLSLLLTLLSNLKK